MEIWDAYTRDGKKTGATLIRGEVIPDGVYHLISDVLCIHDDGDHLIMRRSHTKDIYASHWEATAGGSALQGEDALQCAMRELKEETGLNGYDFQQIGRFVKDATHGLYHVFVCRTSDEKNSVTMQPGETEDYRWLGKEAFKAFIHSGEMIPSQLLRYQKWFEENGLL